MKINGISGVKQRTVTIHFMVDDDTAVEFKLRPLDASDDFEVVMPKPIAPVKIMAGGAKLNDLEDPGYKASVDNWINKRFDWNVLRCLDASEDLVFETVDMANPETWANWQTEFKTAFGNINLGRVIDKFSEVNSLSNDGLEVARKCFLASRRPVSEMTQ